MKLSAATVATPARTSHAGPNRRGPGGAERPQNVVNFICDELGDFELSGIGHPDYWIPVIDRLAADGMSSTQCLPGNAVCAPTRCRLLTGKHPGHAR